MNPINGRQTTCLFLVVLIGWSLTMTAKNGRDGWLILMIACLFSLLFAALCCIPSERMPAVRWFDLPRTAFGNGFGTIYLLLLTALAFWSCHISILNSVVFLRTVSGGQWPIWLLTAALLFCAACTAQNGIQKLVLWTEPVLWVVVIALAVSLLLSWRQLDWSQLLPIWEDGGADVPWRAYLLISAPFGEVFYAAAILGNQGTQIRTGLLRACVLAGVLLSLLYIRNICLLGPNGAAAVLYPSYTAASVLEFGESFQRGEVLISGSLIVCAVARLALILEFLSGCLQAATGHGSEKRIIWIAATLAGILCVLFAGSNQAFAYAQELYQIVFLPFALAAAVALAIGIGIKTKS
ncbi:MAG: GerAB/ArcD/ProY family transporter [Eubacteriales bacterium]|nr:GerAB/ArcD/ProY family transporter [Eubacteriales bacterium]